MDLTLTPMFSVSDLRTQVERAHQAQFNAIRLKLSELGEQFVTNAWANADFQNHTFNLRSSIGYAVSLNGEIIDRMFRTIATGRNGMEAGIRIAEQVVRGIPEGFALIVVAGESYAAAVEAKGKDVLHGSSALIESILRDTLGW